MRLAASFFGRISLSNLLNQKIPQAWRACGISAFIRRNAKITLRG